MIENLVIGSGPVGVTAAHLILSKGYSCTLVDGGKTIEKSKEGIILQLQKIPFKSWRVSDKTKYQHLNTNDQRIKTHVGSKLLFGSKSSYATYGDFTNSSFEVVSDVNFYPSLAIGGLGNVWGSICFPYTNGDNLKLKNPINAAHYDYLSRFLPLAVSSDNLQDIYSLPIKYGTPVTFSGLGRSLKNRFESSHVKFLEKGIFGGQPRVAVDTNGDKACQACGLCATGCVWNSIWDAKSTLEQLKREKSFDTVGNFIVDKILNRGEFFEVLDISGKKLFARRIFLAAGPVSSAILLQKSELISDQVKLDDTQLTILPCLNLGRKQNYNNFVLSQFILNFQNRDSTTQHFVQITGYNPDLARRAQTYNKYLAIIPDKILDFCFRFIAIAMIFEQSSSSGKIVISKTVGKIIVTTEERNQINSNKGNRFSQIKKSLYRLRLIPIQKLSQKVGIGESYHAGNLQSQDGDFLLNYRGEINGVPNLHVIGSASLSHIAPGPITYPAMANAVRIVDAVVTH